MDGWVVYRAPFVQIHCFQPFSSQSRFSYVGLFFFFFCLNGSRDGWGGVPQQQLGFEPRHSTRKVVRRPIEKNPERAMPMHHMGTLDSLCIIMIKLQIKFVYGKVSFVQEKRT